MEDYKKLFSVFPTLKIGVIGDVMLDTYMWGAVERISPEAPVPVVTLHKKDFRIGGAGNVALNIRSLGGQVSLLSVIGNDDEGQQLSDLCRDKGITADYLIYSKERITTNKTRVISRNQQMMRLDAEMTNDISPDEVENLVANVSRYIKERQPDAIIFEDYNKGVLTDAVIRQVIQLCKSNGVLTAVDPKRRNFFSFQGCDIFKPNLKEVKEALNLLVDEVSTDTLKRIHNELSGLLKQNISFITLSEKGVYYHQGDRAQLISSHIRKVADVSGAGDTVIAVATLVYAATKNVHLMAEIANIAGGLVCEEVGTVAIDKIKLLHECEVLLS